MNAKVVIFAVVCLAAVVVADHKKGGHGKHMKCLGKDIIMSEDQKAAMKTCWEESKARKGTAAPDAEKKKHGMDSCFIACKASKNGIIKDGKLDADAISKYIDAGFPEEARAGLKKDMEACSSSITTALSTDNNCESYKALGGCMMKAMKTNCHKKGDE